MDQAVRGADLAPLRDGEVVRVPLVGLPRLRDDALLQRRGRARSVRGGGHPQAVFTAWFVQIGAVRKLEHRKVLVLAFTRVLEAAPAVQSPVLHSGLPQVIAQLSVQAIDCWRLRKAKQAKGPDRESSSEEESDDECQDLREDEDVDHSKYLNSLAALAAQESDDSDDDSDSDDERSSPLDDVDELERLQVTLQQLPPQAQQQVARTLGAEMPRLQQTLEEAAAARQDKKMAFAPPKR